MDSPSTFSEEIHRAKWVARMPPISTMTATSRRGIRRSVFSRRRAPLRTRIVAPMMSVAMARRYRAIVMGGEVLHVMKIDANETETTARAIAAYGPPRIGSGPDRLYLTPVPRRPRFRFNGNRRKVFRPPEHTARSRESMQESDIKKIAVIGAGTMGAGIAQACAAAGFQVTMRDIEQRFVDGGFRRIREPLQKRVERGKMAQADVDAILSKIRGVVSLKEAVDGALVVIEAVFEKMEIKKELYAELDRLCPPSVVFASNTSSLSITEMATATKRADRVVGMHFFNPAPVMKLVEVIRGSETSDETVRLIRDVCAKLGKEAVEVKESPGFVVNRLLVPMMNEAFNLLQEGVASPEDIDKAMKLGTNMPMGPFELADYTGLDIGLDVMEVLFRETGDPKFRPSTLLRKYVRAGRLGRKTGRGVYPYPRP